MDIIQKRADELTTNDKLASADHRGSYKVCNVEQVEGEGTVLILQAPSGSRSVYVYDDDARVEVVA